MKRISLIVILLLALTATSCHKTCRCTGYDRTITEFSRQEVDEKGGSCSGMRMQYGTRYYSLCEWE